MKYADLVGVYKKVAATSKRLEKTFYVSEFIKTVKPEDLPRIMLLLQGRIFPSYDERKVGVAARLVLKAIEVATGIPKAKVEDRWKELGDLGDTAGKLVEKKKQVTLFSTELTVKKVFDNVQKLASIEGKGSVDIKIKLIAELLSSASADEATYVVRTVLEDLRVGIGEGTMRDAIAWAFFPKLDVTHKFCAKNSCNSIVPSSLPSGKCMKCRAELSKNEFSKDTILADLADFIVKLKNREVDVNDIYTFPGDTRAGYNYIVNAVQESYDILNDFAEVATIAKQEGVEGLRKVKLKTGKPLKVMLFQKARDIAEAFERVGRPAAVEFKYDGFRVQVHKADGAVTLYTRRLDDVTKQFPDVRQYVEDHVEGESFILDAEVLGFDPKTKKYLPFQSISQRIRRKYDIKETIESFPVELNVFDVVSFEGENLLKKPFRERRDILERAITPVQFKIVPAKQIITEDDAEANAFYQSALDAGQEGVMFKNLEGIYKPGSRVGYGVKVKPVMESLDLVIIGAEWGTGKRSGWLTSYTLACIDPDTGEFLAIGKVGTGMKELEQEEGSSGVTFNQLTELAKPLVINEKGREVTLKPQIVIEINYEEIQASPTYSSGYALRFPRLVQIREDKPSEEASTLDMVEDLYDTQRGRG